ncbi:MAG: helix-turn-helix domain-containing protein [Actinomycetota bacterium]|nr:helix-turn-helix domain-containing protein [Actinomycetota bacterium]
MSTHTLGLSEREIFWRQLLAHPCAALELEGWTEHAEPAAQLRATRRGRLEMVEFEATPQVHRRTSREIRRADVTYYFQTVILTRGAGTLQQDGRIAQLKPGDLVMFENSRPFTWTFTKPWATTQLSIPCESVRLTDSERQAMSARRLSGRDGLSGVAARFIVDLIRHGSQIPDAQSERILAQVSDLAISLFATSANAEYADARQRTMLDRIKGYVETHFRDSGLTPDEIAAVANISTRYLHKLFEGEHESVALYLRGLRLQQARDELLDPRHAHRSVAAIAHGCGFGDISGFNRAFKAAYSINPSDLRRGAPDSPADVQARANTDAHC